MSGPEVNWVAGNWADGVLVLAVGVYLALRETLHRFRRRCPREKRERLT